MVCVQTGEKGFSEALGNSHQSTRRHIPDSNAHSQLPWQPPSHIIPSFFVPNILSAWPPCYLSLIFVFSLLNFHHSRLYSASFFLPRSIFYFCPPSYIRIFPSTFLPFAFFFSSSTFNSLSGVAQSTVSQSAEATAQILHCILHTFSGSPSWQ